ncbi:MAG TPA: hypothetical protein VFV34_12305 [Blastocatellia bacterium]|nr:hypothetical protein [Blastocatellia bacterium]
MADYRALILELIRRCSADRPTDSDSLRQRVDEQVREAVAGLDARDFIRWIADDRSYGSYYFDIKESGACAKPREVAALVLEAIAVDAAESSGDRN